MFARNGFYALTLALFVCGHVTAQLPERLSLTFDAASEVSPDDWMYVAPTPLGVTMADPDTTLSVADGNWNWSISAPGEVLVGVFTEELWNTQLETTLTHSGVAGSSIGFLNRFGITANPENPSSPFAHGYCVLVSTETTTLIDFDFAREPDAYIRAVAQVPTPDGLFDGSAADVLFSTTDLPLASDPNQVVPHFDFSFGGNLLFDNVADEMASWSSGYAGIDVWSIDPFAQATSPEMLVAVDSLVIRGVPEPSAAPLLLVGGVVVVGQRRRVRRR